MTDGNLIVSAARGWLGTRFHHQGRLKKTAQHLGGVDCLGLLVGVATELDLRTEDGMPIRSFDRVDYSHYPDITQLKEQLSQLLQSVDKEELQNGDVLLLNVDGNPQHLGIVSHLPGGQGLIHAYAPARAVVEHLLDEAWRPRIDHAFRFRF